MQIPEIVISFGHSLSHRAELLIPLMVVGFLVGEWIAHYMGVDAFFDYLKRLAARFAARLNRADRSIAKRIWRGLVVTAMLLGAAAILGAILQDIAPLAVLAMIALYGRGFNSAHMLGLYRKARAGTLALGTPAHPTLYTDTHGVLRDTVLTSAEQFATRVVGLSFWYLLGGMPLALAYAVLAEIAPVCAVPLFGWASTGLFALAHAIPRLMTRLVWMLGGLFVPRTKPFAVWRRGAFHGAIAALLGISLGGNFPGRELPWLGEGTPKLTAEHLARWLLVRLAATVWLLGLLASGHIYNLLIKLI